MVWWYFEYSILSFTELKKLTLPNNEEHRHFKLFVNDLKSSDNFSSFKIMQL